MDDSQTFLCNSCVTSLRDCLGWVDSAHPLSQSFDGRILLAEFIQKITGDDVGHCARLVRDASNKQSFGIPFLPLGRSWPNFVLWPHMHTSCLVYCVTYDDLPSHPWYQNKLVAETNLHHQHCTLLRFRVSCPFAFICLCSYNIVYKVPPADTHLTRWFVSRSSLRASD